MNTDRNFWELTPQEFFRAQNSSPQGLTTQQALLRRPRTRKAAASPFHKDLVLFLSQFKNPLVLLLVFSLLISSVLGEVGNSLIIFGVLFLTGIVGFIQERNAGHAVERLRNMVSIRSTVVRDGTAQAVLTDEVVRGDLVLLKAGDIIPGDGLILESKDLYVNESVLTGESFPAEKKADAATGGSKKNAVFRGTSVVSGTARIVVAATGDATELGKIEQEMGVIANETAFEKGIRKFGYLIMRVSLLLAGAILAYNLVAGKSPAESFLFALAISVGLAPELLPSIITITLSAGAKRLAEKKVIVKKLASIQNLGAIDVLCSDKTGTLTEGVVKIHQYVSPDGGTHERIGLYAFLNATFESGFTNPLDEAIRRDAKCGIDGYRKLDEVPYDFVRKRLSIVVSKNNAHLMITKGALKNVLEVCTQIELSDGSIREKDAATNRQINEYFSSYSREGFRVLGICYKDVTNDPVITKEDEQGMVFLGFILLADPLKAGITETIGRMNRQGVALKLITGDNALIAHHIAEQLHIRPQGIVTGAELHHMSDEALMRIVVHTDIFAETEPSQKERIVNALQKAGYTVGYLGDGINDASALRAADVGITVNNAVDVAKDAADMVLLEQDLDVLSDGIIEGRKTYLNTLKYIFITTSANFGNMASMAIASLMLPFLPLLPMQILLVNFLTDLPSLAIASDSVDAGMLDKPRKWNMKLIRNFMIVFGLESSLFDFLTFGALYFLFHASPVLFRTGWFMESVLTEVLILLVIRTRFAVWKSRPGRLLLLASGVVVVIVMSLPFLPVGVTFGFMPLPGKLLAMILLVALLYIIVGEATKQYLFRKLKF